MAWKIHSALQAVGTPTHAAYPGGAYRVRFDWGEYTDATIEPWLTQLVLDGRYPLPYIEIGYVTPPSNWTTAMQGWADIFSGAGCEYVQFGNEINRGATPGSDQNNPYETYQELWDGYLERAKISAPIFRAAGVGMMLTSFGPTKFHDEWFRFIANRGGYKYFDCVSVHCYPGGDHQNDAFTAARRGFAAGSSQPALGTPADSQRKLEDARASLDDAGPNTSTLDIWMTEVGVPTIATEATDPTHQTYCTPAEQATFLSGVFTRFYAQAAANRCRMISWFTSTDYQPASITRVNGETTGGWPLHCGLKWEAGTPRCTAEGGGTCHKPSWAAFVADAGIGRGTAGVKPDLTAPSVSGITATGATITGTCDANGLPTTWRVEHGADANFGTRTTTTTIASGTNPVAISKALTGLTSGITYHVRFTAWNDAGFAWSTKTTFNTLGTGPSFWVTPNRSAGAGTSPITTNEAIPSSPNPALVPGQTYYYRLVASNSAGISYGAQQSFVTTAPPQSPSVTTGPATAVTKTGATLTGFVNPNASAITNYHFEYGTTTSYGSSTSAGTVASGTADVSVQAVLSGLTFGQTVHYRLVATNAYGTTNGVDRFFVVTAPGVPTELDPITILSTLLSVEATTYDGRHYRWDMEDSNTQNRPVSTTFATQTGDGFAEASCQLPRPIDLNWPDLNLLDRVRFIAADGSTAYEGRVAGLPRRVDSDGQVIEVQLQGLMASARDRSFVEIYADRSGDRWQEASLPLRLAYANIQNSLDVDYVPQVDVGSLSFKGGTGKLIHAGSQGVLIWQAPTGVLAKTFAYKGDDKGVSMIRCNNPTLFASDSDAAELGDAGVWTPRALTMDNTLQTITLADARKFLGLRLRSNEGHTPAADNAAHRIFHKICVYGNHGVTLRDNGANIPQGVFASDVLVDIIERFCPQLNADGVKQTATVLSHLVFDSPTTPFDAFLLLNGYHLWTLGAWEDGRVDYGPADLTRTDWQLRAENPGVTLDLQGDSTDQFANGIVVGYTDINDRAQVLWPTDYDVLVDSDPDNPANRQGIELWTSLELSNPVPRADALALGEAALAEFNRPKAPGTINVTLGYVEDSQGNLQPGHKVRANQTLAITDLPNDTPRLITATNWNEDGNLTVTLEQPPTRIDAVLARLDLSQRSAGIG